MKWTHVTTTIPVVTLRKAYTGFGTDLIDRIFVNDAESKRDLSAFKEQALQVLETLVGEKLGKKTPKGKKTKVKAVKKSSKPKGPSASALAKAAKLKQARDQYLADYLALTGNALKASDSMANKEIRSLLSAAKKADKKAKAEAKKLAKAKVKAESKTSKPKPAPKGPNKTELKRQAVIADIDAILATEDAKFLPGFPVLQSEFDFDDNTKLGDLRKIVSKMQKAIKTAQKAATPKRDLTAGRRLKNKESFGVKGENGSFLRTKVDKATREVIKVNESNWTADANALYAFYWPNGTEAVKVKKAKKVKKTKKVKGESKAAENAKGLNLIKSLVADVSNEVLTEQVTTSGGESKTSTVKEPEVEEIEEDEELDEEELAELSDDSSDDEEDDEVVFPGIEELSEIELDCRPGQQLYIDDELNVWNDQQVCIGQYDTDTHLLVE